jgi:hypothetical protein
MVCFLCVSPSKPCNYLYSAPHRPRDFDSVNQIIFSEESQIGMTSGCSKRTLISWKRKVSLRKYVMEDNEDKNQQTERHGRKLGEMSEHSSYTPK